MLVPKIGGGYSGPEVKLAEVLFNHFLVNCGAYVPAGVVVS